MYTIIIFIIYYHFTKTVTNYLILLLHQSIYDCTLIFIRILFYQVEELENPPLALKFPKEGLTDTATVVDEDSFDDEDLRFVCFYVEIYR
jgi:hypothetical protein